MAHKTFISYKYSDVVEGRENNNLRDRIINKLGENAQYYQGENGYTKDLSSYSADYIKRTLKDMIRDTTVTIVIISPNMQLSQWMNWELSYSLSEITRANRTSLTNGMIAVVQKQNTFGYLKGYEWFKGIYEEWDLAKTFEIIRKNQNNKKSYAPGYLPKNYIDIVTEDILKKSKLLHR